MNFEIVYLNEATQFIRALDKKAVEKLLYCITYAKQTSDPDVFKKLVGTNIWEFRFIYRRVKYRLFSFWDTEKGALVVCTHGIVKKTDKTPQKEIDKAESIRKQYYKDKYGKQV
jgi:phage-related protein